MFQAGNNRGHGLYMFNQVAWFWLIVLKKFLVTHMILAKVFGVYSRKQFQNIYLKVLSPLLHTMVIYSRMLVTSPYL